ncbi:hypothetical protein [Nostoc sp. ATCC 53789]|uniref:hypothetical protein n=1 Tax=Nostoc sp. ATCC 53789 TaxID=76335 RepID=UPI00132EE258|nr:hypothetical protein [Nostoc sp. ATCC 53789]MBD2509640.1 hypothetical protein [Desmonostoc muscorum FACHB-395]QHG18611.1 hypothetical protein GJB62_23275 [Nostoc sp. ATCC 53789]
MVNPFTQKPEPYPFKGGDASEYKVFIIATWYTYRNSFGSNSILMAKVMKFK